MNKEIKDKRVVIWIMLFLAFVMAQNVTWRIVGLFIEDEILGEKLFSILQIEGVCIYTLLTIYYTKDNELVRKFLKGKSILNKLIMFLLNISVVIFISLPSILLLIPEFFNPNYKSEDTRRLKTEMKQEIEKYQDSNVVVKILIGISCLTIILLVISFFVKPDVIYVIADVMSLILNIVLFFIVCANVIPPFIEKDK